MKVAAVHRSTGQIHTAENDRESFRGKKKTRTAAEIRTTTGERERRTAGNVGR